MPASRFLAPALASLLLTIPAAAQPLLVLKPLWKFSTTKAPHAEATGQSSAERTVDWITKFYQKAIADRKTAGRPLIPPFVPVAYENWVVHHDNKGPIIRSLVRVPGPAGEYKAGDIGWDGNLEVSLADMAGRIQDARRWTRSSPPSPQQPRPNRSGRAPWSMRLAVHDGVINVVDELAFLPPPLQPGGLAPSFGLFQDAVYGKCLKGFSIETGKLTIKIGPADQKPALLFPPQKGAATKNWPVRGVRFVSVPLSVADDLAFLTERNRSVWVTRLNVAKYERTVSGRRTPEVCLEALSKETVWETELIVANESVVNDPHRRIHAIHLVEANGLVICPTHLGRVIAVDAKTGKAKWTHEYAPSPRSGSRRSPRSGWSSRPWSRTESTCTPRPTSPNSCA